MSQQQTSSSDSHSDTPSDAGDASAAPSADETNIGRVIALRLGCGDHVPGWTVMRNCASGMQALDSAAMGLQTGRHDLVLAGGVDALSRAPLLFPDEMVHWLAQWNQARTLAQRLPLLRRFRPAYFKPVIGLLKGLSDPVIGLSMGQTAENLVHRFGLTRAQLDAYAAQSHARVLAARARGAFDEIVPLIDARGTLSVTLKCPAGGNPCTGTITLTTNVTKKVRGRKKVTTVRLGTVTFSVEAGKSRAVRLKLSASGRSLLRKSKRLATSAAIKLTVGGQSKTTSRALTLKAPSAKKR